MWASSSLTKIARAFAACHGSGLIARASSVSFRLLFMEMGCPQRCQDIYTTGWGSHWFLGEPAARNISDQMGIYWPVAAIWMRSQRCWTCEGVWLCIEVGVTPFTNAFRDFGFWISAPEAVALLFCQLSVSRSLSERFRAEVAHNHRTGGKRGGANTAWGGWHTLLKAYESVNHYESGHQGLY